MIYKPRISILQSYTWVHTFNIFCTAYDYNVFIISYFLILMNDFYISLHLRKTYNYHNILSYNRII